MAIFTSNSIVNENLETLNDIQPTTESMDQILYEFNSGVNDTLSALYVSDIMIECAVDNGTNNAETLIEGTVKDALGNAVKWFEELLRKIGVWFKKVINSLTDYSKLIQKFINKNKALIEANADAALKSASIPTITNGIYYVDNDTFLKELNAFYKDVNHFFTIMQGAGVNEDKYEYQGLAGNLIDSAGVKELVKKYRKTFFNNEEKNSIEEQGLRGDILTRENINKSIELCEKGPQLIKDVNDIYKQTEGIIKNRIADLKSAMGKNDDANSIRKINNFKKAVTGLQSMNNFFITVRQNSIKAYYGIVFVVFQFAKSKKNTKSEATPTEDSATSIFETAYNML